MQTQIPSHDCVCPAHTVCPIQASVCAFFEPLHKMPSFSSFYPVCSADAFISRRAGDAMAKTVLTIFPLQLNKMFKTVLFLTLVASCLGDNAPTGGYGAPSGGGYDAPTGYDAPQAGYGDYDQGGYELADEGGDDIGAKLGELIPLFLVVFAAIILAQLLAPLLLSLLGIVVGILPMALSIKAPIVNLILNPFGLQLCTTAAVPVAFPRSIDTSRSLKEAVTSFGFDVSEDKINIVADFVNQAMESFSSKFDSYSSV